jgi:hypothetical protein
MDIVWAALTVVVVTGAAVGAMLLVRRRAPEGSHFKDGDRAAGVFGVIATGFSVLLGFIVVLAFTTYDASRSGAENEALTVGQQVETAQFFPPAASKQLTGQLLCYARSVAGPEWEQLRSGSAKAVNPWGLAMFRTVRGVEPKTASEQAAYSKWLDQTADRETARQDRIHPAAGVIPDPLWIVLFLITGLIVVFMLFFADSDEGPVTQGMLMGSVVCAIVVLLLLLRFLDNPYKPGVGALEPVAMKRTIALIDDELRDLKLGLTLPCDARGERPG